jgi:hypothetical protein
VGKPDVLNEVQSWLLTFKARILCSLTVNYFYQRTIPVIFQNAFSVGAASAAIVVASAAIVVASAAIVVASAAIIVASAVMIVASSVIIAASSVIIAAEAAPTWNYEPSGNNSK